MNGQPRGCLPHGDSSYATVASGVGVRFGAVFGLPDQQWDQMTNGNSSIVSAGARAPWQMERAVPLPGAGSLP